jgi:hypothetical protein
MHGSVVTAGLQNRAPALGGDLPQELGHSQTEPHI